MIQRFTLDSRWILQLRPSLGRPLFSRSAAASRGRKGRHCPPSRQRNLTWPSVISLISTLFSLSPRVTLRWQPSTFPISDVHRRKSAESACVERGLALSCRGCLQDIHTHTRSFFASVCRVCAAVQRRFCLSVVIREEGRRRPPTVPGLKSLALRGEILAVTSRLPAPGSRALMEQRRQQTRKKKKREQGPLAVVSHLNNTTLGPRRRTHHRHLHGARCWNFPQGAELPA